MPIYRLWRPSDDKTFEKEARDDKHALVLFGQELGVTLTLEEGPAVAEYMMGRIEKAPGWTMPLDIPVYEVRQRSN